MPLVKAQQTIPAIKEAVVLDLGDIGAQAARVRMAAEAKAQQILQEAEEKAKGLIEEAKGRGYEVGHEHGLKEGTAAGREAGYEETLQKWSPQIERVVNAWSDVLQQWDRQRQTMMREARQETLRFALQMAEQLVHRVVEVDPDLVVDQLEHALGLVLSPTEVTVRVHSVDLEVVEAALPGLIGAFESLENIQLMPDDDIGPGGCALSFGEGQVDATIETQVRRVVDAILPAPEVEPESEPEPTPQSQTKTVASTAAAPSPSSPESPVSAVSPEASESVLEVEDSVEPPPSIEPDAGSMAPTQEDPEASPPA